MSRPAFGPMRVALRLLTAVPVPGSHEEDRHARRLATSWFPLVGLLLGLPLYAILRLPLPPLPGAALALAGWVVLTGGLHEDGWMDTLDAAFAPGTREHRLRILKDPHLGAHGVTGGVLLQLTRFAALSVVPPVAVLIAPVIGRWAMAASLALAPRPKPDGLGVRYATGAGAIAPTGVALTLLIVLAVLAGPVRTLAAILVAALAGALWGAFLVRRFGGLSGDGHGAVGVVTELTALWVFLPVPCCD